jgi:hypothetical protein
MKRLLSILAVLTCLAFSARAGEPAKTPAVKFLEANDGVRGAKHMNLDGLMLKMARPTLKKTPVAAILNELESLHMFSFKEGRENEEKAFVTAAQKMLKSYVKVSEINDEISHMVIYVDPPKGNTCHEMILLITWPGTNMMVFHGDFTEESLRRMDEISKKQRAEGGSMQKGLYGNGQLPD